MKLFKIVDTKTGKQIGDPTFGENDSTSNWRYGETYYASKMKAKKVRNKLEGYTPVADENGKYPAHTWRYQIKPGVDHWKNQLTWRGKRNGC